MLIACVHHDDDQKVLLWWTRITVLVWTQDRVFIYQWDHNILLMFVFSQNRLSVGYPALFILRLVVKTTQAVSVFG